MNLLLRRAVVTDEGENHIRYGRTDHDIRECSRGTKIAARIIKMSRRRNLARSKSWNRAGIKRIRLRLCKRRSGPEVNRILHLPVGVEVGEVQNRVVFLNGFVETGKR